jgi:hypothetical protein
MALNGHPDHAGECPLREKAEVTPFGYRLKQRLGRSAAYKLLDAASRARRKVRQDDPGGRSRQVRR